MSLDNLRTALDNMESELATVTAAPKRSYSVDGRSFSHAEYEEQLILKIENLQRQIFAREGAPEIQTIVYG